MGRLLDSVDTIIAAIGLLCILAGLYLWLGLAASLITLGLALIWIGIRMPEPGLPGRVSPRRSENES